MIYAFLSSENPCFSFAEQKEILDKWKVSSGLKIESWIIDDSYVSENFSTGDIIVVADFSVFGKLRLAALENICTFLSFGCKIISVSNNQCASGEDFYNAIKLCIDLEKRMISASTKAGLRRAMEQGTLIGRKPGQSPSKTKLSGYEDEIKEALNKGITKSELARKYNVSWVTIRDFIQRNLK